MKTFEQYYNTKKPYSSIFYSIGAHKDQSLKIFTSQNLNKYINFGFEYNIISNEGMLLRQRARDHSMLGYVSILTKRYSLLLNAYSNTFKTLSNGGLLTDSLFEQTTTTTQTLSVKLKKATNSICY